MIFLYPSYVRSLIKKLDVTIEKSFYLMGDGHYIAHLNIIVLNAKLDEEKELIVLLHELGHAAKHQEDYTLYNTIFAHHARMEAQADKYMIAHLLELYLSDPEITPSTINAINFLKGNELDMRYENYVKELLRKYILGVGTI